MIDRREFWLALAGASMAGRAVAQQASDPRAIVEEIYKISAGPNGKYEGKSVFQLPEPRKRVGLLLEGKQPAREGAEIEAADGAIIGKVTSGGFGPTLKGPLAMGYVDSAHAAPGTAVQLLVRGKPLPARVAAMPFVPHRYARAKA